VVGFINLQQRTLKVHAESNDSAAESPSVIDEFKTELREDGIGTDPNDTNMTVIMTMVLIMAFILWLID
jgi:hypothetical protein